MIRDELSKKFVSRNSTRDTQVDQGILEEMHDQSFQIATPVFKDAFENH
jgi:hypothetical protein